ncbi:MAG: hydrolase [Candidatus Altiarchaeota archaeon]|nr:hydrolase [Candidatus Altiarchaeota archaeon]
MVPGFLARDDTLLVVVDVQEHFRPAIFQFDRLVKNARKLADGCRILDVPIIVTEQYPEGLGGTVPELVVSLGGIHPIVKTSFSCFGERHFVDALNSCGRRNIILTGIESHVCVLRTALDALSQGFNVHVAVDAISSIHESDHDIAVERLKQANVFLVSSEMALFQLLDDSKQPEFKKLSAIVKKYA